MRQHSSNLLFYYKEKYKYGLFNISFYNWQSSIPTQEKGKRQEVSKCEIQINFQFVPLVKKFVTDSNAVAQEKGLEAALAFTENCDIAGKAVNEVVDGLVTKCLAAPKTKTKDLAKQVRKKFSNLKYILLSERHFLALWWRCSRQHQNFPLGQSEFESGQLLKFI